MGGMGGPYPLQGLSPPHQDLSPPSKKNLSGGDLIIHGGGNENVLDGGGGTSLDWGDSPFMGCGPPIPPMLGTPGPQFLDQQQQQQN